MIDEIEKEINGFYGKYARKEGITMAEARKRAAQAGHRGSAGGRLPSM